MSARAMWCALGCNALVGAVAGVGVFLQGASLPNAISVAALLDAALNILLAFGILGAIAGRR